MGLVVSMSSPFSPFVDIDEFRTAGDADTELSFNGFVSDANPLKID